MPKYLKPRRDFPDLPDIDPEHPTIFTGPAFDRLCADWHLPPDVREVLQIQLERAAAAYFRNKAIYDGMPKAGEKRAALAEIEALATKLSDRLEGMDPFTSGLFWRPETEIAGFAVRGEESPYGHRFSAMPGPDGQTMTVYLDRDDLTAAVRILENYARHARETVPAGRTGRPGMVGLRNWIGNIADLWERIFERPFTVDFHGNAPTSDAAAFCWATVQILDPAVTFAQARTAMRDQVKKARARTNRNRGEIPP